MEQEYIKLKEWAKRQGVHFNTAYRRFHKGLIEGAYQEPTTKSIFVKLPKEEEIIENKEKNRVILYARVSSSTNKASLDGQIERMELYAAAKGYVIIDEVKEIASGLNENRRKFNLILERTDYDILLVEHKDRLIRFGYNYIEILLNNKRQRIEVINNTESKDKTQELTEDFISIVTSFCGRLYGTNRKKKTKEIIDTIKD